LRTTGFIKRILGPKKVEKKEDKPATELTLRVIETQVVEMKEVFRGMSGNLEKIAKATDSLSKYFDYELKRLREMEAVESAPPTKGDLLY